MLQRVCKFALALACAAAGGCAANRPAGTHWSVGPFVEVAPGEGLYAVRPFWSRDTRTTAKDETVHDVLWPLATWHSTPGRDWWRFILATGDDAREAQSADSSIALYPFAWWKRDGTEDSFGLFPIAGHHPHILLMDDFSFGLWPLYHSYTVAGVRSRAVLWPFATWREAPREGFGLWPLYGYSTHRESFHRYALWPLATWAKYERDRDSAGAGYSWMAWPLAGHVSREREKQYLLLPPFISWTRTPQTWRLRAPWPFVEIERGRPRNRVSAWPFYEYVEAFGYGRAAAEEHTHRFGWKLVEYSRIESERAKETRFNFFPFVTWEERSNGDAFYRVWPFWSREKRHGEVVRERVLDLNPIRHAPGVERNWASFWTLWRREKNASSTCHHFFFDFFWWHE